jgi:hypothetical protein
MNRSTIALAAALVFGISTGALAIDGYDGDNNPVPGAYAAQRSAVARQIVAETPPYIGDAFASSVVLEHRMFGELDGDGNPIPGAR